MASWKKVASMSELSDDCGYPVTVDGHVIALALVEGQVYAVDDLCTHADASLCDGMVDGDEIECPLHFARFNLKTGQATCPPADKPVRTYNVRVVGDDVEVEI